MWPNVISTNTVKLLLLPCPIKQRGNGAVPSSLEGTEDCVLVPAQTPGPGQYVGSGAPVLLCLCPAASARVEDWGNEPLSQMGKLRYGEV